MKTKKIIATALLVLMIMTTVASALAEPAMVCPKCGGSCTPSWTRWTILYRYFELGPAEIKHEVQERKYVYHCHSCSYSTVEKTETRDIRIK